MQSHQGDIRFPGGLMRPPVGLGSGSGSVTSRLPVFVFPAQLTFYADDPSSHKQVLTLYNPYEFTIAYRVLTTAPKKFMVVDAEGTIKKKCRVDIVVRHEGASLPENIDKEEKLRIQIYDMAGGGLKGTPILGRADIPANLVSSAGDQSAPSEQSFYEQGSGIRQRHYSVPVSASDRQQQQLPITHDYSIAAAAKTPWGGPSWVVLLVGAACVVALMLPTYLPHCHGNANHVTASSDQSAASFLPWYLYLTISQKLVAAYILGLVTLSIFRTS